MQVALLCQNLFRAMRFAPYFDHASLSCLMRMLAEHASCARTCAGHGRALSWRLYALQAMGASIPWTCFPASMTWTMMSALWMLRSWKCCSPDDPLAYLPLKSRSKGIFQHLASRV